MPGSCCCTPSGWPTTPGSNGCRKGEPWSTWSWSIRRGAWNGHRPTRTENDMPTAEDTVRLLREQVIELLKRRFVGRDEVIELIALAIVAGEHLFLHGPPGTAKSAIIRQFAVAIRGSYFEYLLTRFS